MSKKIFLLSFLFVLIAVFSLQNAMAYNPNWKAEQDKMFEQIGLKPGDVIDATNWKQVQDVLPESIAGYVKKGEFILKIGEMKYDYGMDAEWEKASEANRGKYTLGAMKEIISNATGKFPNYLYGRPFPDLDKNDPDLGMKVMHTKSVEESRAGNQDHGAATIFISEGGVDRTLYSRVIYNYFWCHPNGERSNPNAYKFTEIVALQEPYDLAGTVILTLRPLDGNPDIGGSYVPALRRVRRTSGTSRSDPFFGSDFTNDDSGGWGGQNETMNWKIVGEKIVLIPKTEWQAQTPDIMRKAARGAWETYKSTPPLVFGADDKEWKGVAWAPVSAVWVPRKMYLIEATPLDPYYNYGKCLYYVDKEAFVPIYKIVQNKAGEHWKTLLVDQYAQDWGDGMRTIDQQGWYLVVDDKTHHACASPTRGPWGKYKGELIFCDPMIKDRNFTFASISSKSK